MSDSVTPPLPRPTSLRETPLCQWHAAHGGRMVDFAGWNMPVQYASIVDEHLATRSSVGLFDVSHMGRLSVTGPGALDWLESMLTRKVAGIVPGQFRYTLVTADAPAPVVILDDALVSRDSDAADGTPRMGLVINAGNRERVVAWLRSRLPATGVDLVDHTLETAMIAVQGPKGVDLVAGLSSGGDGTRIRALGNYRGTTATVAGHAAAVSRTGYTGEDGVEVTVAAADAVAVWEAILAAALPLGGRSCGLGARDTLRLEAGMPLYGHELGADSDPFALGLALAVNLEGRTFPGRGALTVLKARQPERVRIGLDLGSKRSAREGNPVLGGAGGEIGVVTSGSFAPTIGHAVAMALVAPAFASEGTVVEIAIRDARQQARVVGLPFYRRPPGGGKPPAAG
ncbi:MAG: glycine cleavage system aminomethyltransferase GcvT [Planctomycetia bacterium]